MAREYYAVARGFSLRSTLDRSEAIVEARQRPKRKDGGEWVDEKGAVHSGACES